jgi:hypothetical protein
VVLVMRCHAAKPRAIHWTVGMVWLIRSYWLLYVKTSFGVYCLE